MTLRLRSTTVARRLALVIWAGAVAASSPVLAQTSCPDGQTGYFGHCPAPAARSSAGATPSTAGGPRSSTGDSLAFESGYALFRQGREKEAAAQFQIGAAQNDPRSTFALGLLYWKFQGPFSKPYSPQTRVTAYKLIRKAAEQGYAPAETVLGGLYEESSIRELLGYHQMKNPPKKPPPGDYSGEPWLRKAASGGYQPAMLLMACRAFNGPMYTSNERRAKAKADGYREQIYWFSRLADAGNGVAEFNMGVLYDTGRGVAKDKARAREYYNRAAAHVRMVGPVQNLKVLDIEKSEFPNFVDFQCPNVQSYMRDLSGVREVAFPGMQEAILTFKGYD